MVAIDGSDQSSTALKWACRNLVGSSELHLVTVLPPMAYSVYPVAPVATAAAVAAVASQWEVQKRHDEVHATNLLKDAAQVAVAEHVAQTQLHAHSLPAAGGASGVAESLCEFARAKEVDVVVVGSRGLGSISRSLMSLVGLGSVSDYLVHQLHIPVVVVTHPPTPAPQGNGRQQGRHVVMSLDDSVHSQYALTWAASHLLRAGDTVTCLTVALPVPYPILDETSVAIAALEAQQWAASNERSMEYAATCAGKAAAALAGSAPDGVTARAEAVPPAGGASDVGAALCAYAEEHKADLVVVGSRGMGSFKRSIMGFAGLGSVSDYALHHSKGAAVVVVKATEEQLPAAEPHLAAVAGSEAAAGAAGQQPAAGQKDITPKED